MRAKQLKTKQIKANQVDSNQIRTERIKTNQKTIENTKITSQNVQKREKSFTERGGPRSWVRGVELRSRDAGLLDRLKSKNLIQNILRKYQIEKV